MNFLRSLCLCVIVCLAIAGRAECAFAADVVLYSSNPPELLDMVAQGFERESGIKVTVVRLGTAEAMKRIAAEKSNPRCDIFWSGDIAVLDGAKDNFMSYASPEAAGLSAAYVDVGKRWTACNTHIMVLMVNTDLVTPEEMPKSWRDIFSPAWKERIAIANPQRSGSAYAQLYGLYKLHGWEGLAALAENAVVLDSSSHVYQRTAKGEFAIGITMEYAAYRYVAGAMPNIAIVYPEDGVISAPEGLAIVDGAKHLTGAKAFFEYLISKNVVSDIFQRYYRRPVRRDAAMVDGLPTDDEWKLLLAINPEEARHMKKELLKQWRRLLLEKI